MLLVENHNITTPRCRSFVCIRGIRVQCWKSNEDFFKFRGLYQSDWARLFRRRRRCVGKRVVKRSALFKLHYMFDHSSGVKKTTRVWIRSAIFRSYKSWTRGGFALNGIKCNRVLVLLLANPLRVKQTFSIRPSQTLKTTSYCDNAHPLTYRCLFVNFRQKTTPY